MRDKNTFVVDKFQNYLKDAMDTFEIEDDTPQGCKKPLQIPKITRKEQIYWICESCGMSNPYFLPICKECKMERPTILYDKYENVRLLNNSITIKKPISHVITEKWQSLETIAEKMGIGNPEDIKMLKTQVKKLVELNYLIENSDRTKFRMNTFEM